MAFYSESDRRTKTFLASNTGVRWIVFRVLLHEVFSSFLTLNVYALIKYGRDL